MRRNRREFQINPIDTKKATAVGLKSSYNYPGIFGQNYTTTDQLKDNLIDFLLTNEGERVFNLNYGASIRDMVFEQSTSLEEKRQMIRDKIGRYFPQVVINSLDILVGDDYTAYVKLNYSFNITQDELIIGVQSTPV